MSRRSPRLIFPGIASALLLAACETAEPPSSAVGQPLFLGVAAAAGLTPAQVEWPGGRRERFPGLTDGRYHTLHAGRGEALPAPPGEGRG